MKAGASLRLTMNVTQRPMSRSAVRRAVAIATHEFQPAESLPCIRCSSTLETTSRFCSAPAAASRALSQLMNARASLRFTMKLKQRRMSCSASTRSDANSAQACQHIDSLRFIRCSTTLRALSRCSSASRCSSIIATHEFQPAESLPFIKNLMQR